jgi:hypothetical protein
MRCLVIRRIVSSIAWSLFVLLLFAPEAVIAAPPQGAVSLKLYGAFIPAATSSAAASWWGYGVAFECAASERWNVSVDASHFELDGRSLSPIVAGIAYGPGGSQRLRPRVELGGGYYRLGEIGPRYTYALGSTGYPRDAFTGPPEDMVGRDAVGGYFGAGLDWTVATHMGLDLGARAHNWNESGSWSSMLSFRSGLSIHF